MTAKELAITILGLAGTFLMPWPGDADRDPSGRVAGEASVCGRACGEAVATSAREANSPEHPADAKRLAQWRASR
jgi:hypothetical protein